MAVLRGARSVGVAARRPRHARRARIAARAVPEPEEGFPKEAYPSRTSLTGGWAGGEQGLWELREAEKAKAKDGGAAGADETESERSARIADMKKDFNGLVGGFPGGEVGVKSYASTGAVPKVKPDEASVGYGPFLVFGLGAIIALLALAGAGEDPRLWFAEPEVASGELPPLDAPGPRRAAEVVLAYGTTFSSIAAFAVAQMPAPRAEDNLVKLPLGGALAAASMLGAAKVAELF